MKQADITPQFPKIWGYNADAGTLKYPSLIEEDDKSASLEKGYPKANMTPLAAGGAPPRGDLTNGILNMLSLSAQGRETGTIPPWNADFARAIGGYPQTAQIIVIRNGIPDILVSVTDDNFANPYEAGQTSWVSLRTNLQPEFPVGTVVLFHAQIWRPTPPPDGWLPCYGQSFDPAQYPKLQAHLAANGWPLGIVPNFLNRYPRAYQYTVTSEVNTWQEDAIQNMWGGIWNIPSQTERTGLATGGYGVFDKTYQNYYGNMYDQKSGQNEGPAGISFDPSRVVRTADETRPKTIITNFIIKAV